MEPVINYNHNNEISNVIAISQNDLNEFKNASEIIVANRISSDLEEVKAKVYCRDIFEIDWKT